MADRKREESSPWEEPHNVRHGVFWSPGWCFYKSISKSCGFLHTQLRSLRCHSFSPLYLSWETQHINGRHKQCDVPLPLLLLKSKRAEAKSMLRQA